MAKTATVNLFAAGTTVKETAKKAEKKIMAAPLLESKIKKFTAVKATIETAKAELEMLAGDIKQVGKELFLKEYKSQKSTPDNFKIQDKSGAAVLFIVQDKYTLVDETKAEVLSEFPGILAENVVYTIDKDMVEQYGEVLSKMIMKSKEIAEEDKTKLIKGVKTYSVAKGSIDRLLNYKNPEQVFELINPIVALK